METEKKRGRPPKLPESKIEDTEYRLSLTLGDKVYESSGTTVLEALEKIQVPPKIFIKGFVNLSHAGKETNRMFFPAQMKRFLYPVARTLVAKALETTLK